MDHVKWKMSENDMNTFVKSWDDCETALDFLIIRQQIIHEQLLKNLKVIQDKGI
jgi:hypothetical protein